MSGLGLDRKNLQPSAKIGAVEAGNYVALNKEQGVRLYGDSTVWKDMVMDLFSKRLNGTTGKVDYDWDENAIKFQSGGRIGTTVDRVQGNQEINHEFKVGTDITFKPHIHWFQEVGEEGSVTPFVLTMEYRLQRNGHAKTTSWTTITLTAGSDDIFDFSGEDPGTYNQLTRFPDITVTCGVSDTLQFRMARTDTEGGDMLVYFFDLHGQVDSHGSDDEIAKT